ncbi:deoxyribonuclease-1-like [Sphaeramia orbicularis]|uniref:Deoxyribonuclease-1-like n=1 Tax=Sphaeramia orbicularis TaxID=375764 RepID=A0A672ZNW1_9TELE|nr:deoxyribonuclease-1-like [Sphaeramia orbicularis]XP_029990634.1 deoxyribonuclease-1-like [Sphaeramia orbicularis]
MKIAAFNVKNLGIKKVTDQTVVGYICKILCRYSVVFILEVVDKSGRAMKKLLQRLNSISSNPYSMTSSRPLGRHHYKEKFVCFYRGAEVTLEACHQYEDNQAGDEDAFAREPFILRFSCPTTLVKNLVLIPVHTKPEDSLKELDELHDVVGVIRNKWKTDNILILGDFNADGRYLSKRKMETIRIRSQPYHWLINDTVDTTSSNLNDHTYDRIVVYGRPMLNSIVPGSAKSFNFQKEFHLNDDTTLSISDHYPVEVELKMDPKHDGLRGLKTPRTGGPSPNTGKGPKKRVPEQRKRRNRAPKRKAAAAAAAAQSNLTTAAVKRRRIHK